MDLHINVCRPRGKWMINLMGFRWSSGVAKRHALHGVSCGLLEIFVHVTTTGLPPSSQVHPWSSRSKNSIMTSNLVLSSWVWPSLKWPMYRSQMESFLWVSYQFGWEGFSNELQVHLSQVFLKVQLFTKFLPGSSPGTLLKLMFL